MNQKPALPAKFIVLRWLARLWALALLGIALEAQNAIDIT